jgi:hypothetical protein
MADPAWEETDKNLTWSLVTGNPDQGGKAKMVDALTRASLAFAEELRIGFEETQKHNDKAIQAFSLCLHSDTKRLYNLARSKLGMAPI